MVFWIAFIFLIILSPILGLSKTANFAVITYVFLAYFVFQLDTINNRINRVSSDMKRQLSEIKEAINENNLD